MAPYASLERENKMTRLICGIVLAVLGLLSVVSAGNNPQGPAPSIIVGLLFLAGGGTLIFFGARYLSRRRTVIGFALQMLRTDGKINGGELSQRCGMNEVDIRGYLNDAQRKGIIPFRADIV